MQNKNKKKPLLKRIRKSYRRAKYHVTTFFKKMTLKTKAIIAGALVVTAGLFVIVGYSISKMKNNKNNQSTTSISNTIEQTSLNDLGAELPLPSKEDSKKEYANATGKVDINKIVIGNNGKIYADKEAKDNFSKVGNTTIDTKNDTLVVKPNGEVHQKQEEYEIIKDGEVIESGKIEQKPEVTPNGEVVPNDKYEYNENLDSIIKEEDKEKVENTVVSEYNFYNANGDLVISKGDVVTKEYYEKLKKNYFTTKPEQKHEEKDEVIEETVEPSIEEGTINSNGTYTIYGLTFQTKSDYQQWIIQGYEGYEVDVDGIMKPINLEKTKTLVK